MVKVFDRAQVDPLPEFPGGPVVLDPPLVPVEGDGLAGLFEPLASFATTIGYTVVVEEIPGSALGYSRALTRQHIGVETISSRVLGQRPGRGRDPRAGPRPRPLRPARGDPELTYGDEEVVVECVAYTVCSTVGLDTSGWSVPYMAHVGRG